MQKNRFKVSRLETSKRKISMGRRRFLGISPAVPGPSTRSPSIYLRSEMRKKVKSEDGKQSDKSLEHAPCHND